jgi:hypothetical protein
MFEMSLNERRIPFPKPETIRAFKVIALSGYGERPLTSLAELLVMEAK